MENASKALIMAGAILIAVVIIALGTAIFRTMSNHVTSNTDLTEEQIAQFNGQISPYLGTQSGSYVNALIQRVRSINQTIINGEGISGAKGITITYPKGSLNEQNTFNGEKKVPTGVYYKVTESYAENGLINEVDVNPIKVEANT